MPNKLSQSTSPYLLQHADNPVDWYEWGKEAFNQAKKEKKPIFLSIGYSTCHWCHVMAHESFVNKEIAKIMNELFINIKVDKEERPDIDSTYMMFLQATTGSGGWPLSVWLTPDLTPFVAGTYFPPEDKGGRMGFSNVLNHVSQLWKKDPDDVTKHGKTVIEKLQNHINSSTSDTFPNDDIFKLFYAQISGQLDKEKGGFSPHPKFPQPSFFHALLRIQNDLKDQNPTPTDMASFTLEKMALGGIYDHLSGGFHRYSVDSFWHIPHFEKMLYDQGQLAKSYLEFYTITQNQLFLETANSILDYLNKYLSHPEGGFYSAEDADSLDKTGHSKEGAYYVWEKSEVIETIKTNKAEEFCTAYGIEETGNGTLEGDSIGEFKGENILFRKETTIAYEEEKKLLLAKREQRPKPHRDEKIISGWNAYTISAFALSSRLQNNQEHLDTARKAVDFIKANLWDKDNLYRSWKTTRNPQPAFATDYTNLIEALLELYQATGDINHIKWAQEIQQQLDLNWWDNENGGYYSTKANSEIKLSIKEYHDGAEPSDNGIGANNLLRLSAILHNEDYKQKAEKIISWAGEYITHSPVSCPQLVTAYRSYKYGISTIAVVGDNTPLIELRKRLLPSTIIIDLTEIESKNYLTKHNSIYQNMEPSEGKFTAYYCSGNTCSPPVTSLEKLSELIDKK